MNDKLLSLLYHLGVVKYLRGKKMSAQKSSLSILSLHRVSEAQDPCWQPLSPKNFEILLKYVRQHYNIIRLSDIANLPKKATKPALVLSFDDGYKDFMDYALPLLQKYELPCNHNFVIDCLEQNATIWTQRLNAIFNQLFAQKTKATFYTAQQSPITIDFTKSNWYSQYIQLFQQLLKTPYIERSAQIRAWEDAFNIEPHQANMMNWADLAACQASGLVEIGSHTYSHDSMITLIDSPEMLRQEVEASKKMLESRLNIPINIFALPNGQGDEKVTAAANAAGYKILLAVGGQLNWLDDSADLEQLQSYQRLNIINETRAAMLLRVEFFQTRMQQLLGR
jgi:peptidoglycan/xylan/chitin deacetylase (PgdA/CDA1 family)